MSAIRLGLIGGNIAASQSPALHRIAGRLCGLDVSYELLTPSLLNKSFADVFEACVHNGFRGLNITYPFKEDVIQRVAIADHMQAEIGSCNTVVFDTPCHRGANTDFSGFMKAFRQTFGAVSPGHVAIAGSGGVGKAVAFALATLGADGLSIFDLDRAKAEALKASLHRSFDALPVCIESTVAAAMSDADGLVNCTPLGMDGKGNAFPAELLSAQIWAFDAVYTPVNTPFLQAARKAGLAIMSGYELFLHQGIDAFQFFTGHDVDPDALRQALGTYPEQVRSA